MKKSTVYLTFEQKIEKTCLLLVAVVLFFFFNPLAAQETDTLRLGFGSCSKANEDQSYWHIIAQQDIEAWIWLGDIVYADSPVPSVIKKKYKSLKQNPNYKTFESDHDIYGVWDDHDYGQNDGGKNFRSKEKSRDILFKFLNVPKSDKAWRREGAYQSYRVEHNQLTVRLILLDVRYFRDQLKANPHPSARYFSDVKAEMLGESQWKWLEGELEMAGEDVVILASGTQIIPTEHPYEKWADYPAERSRLLDLIRKNSNKKIVLLSGDRHMAEVSALAVNADLFLYERHHRA